MQTRDIVVIGGSAGALDAMQEIVRSLPGDFPAAIFIVLHMAADFPSMLPQILNRSGRIPARHPADREVICHGRIYAAPSDRHLTIEDGKVRVTRGPRENRHRPAIDPLFRTAARVGQARVIGVVLSGQMDDGSAGLRAVRSLGGLAIVQDPVDAAAPEMPASALKYSGADYVLPVSAIGPKLVDLVTNSRSKSKQGASSLNPGNGEENLEENLNVSRPSESQGTPSVFACPECNGVLWELQDGKLVRFRCRVGHAYTMANLAEEHAHEVEGALWGAMRALEEKAALATRMSDSTSDPKIKKRFLEEAEADRDRAETIRDMLFSDEEKEGKPAV